MPGPRAPLSTALTRTGRAHDRDGGRYGYGGQDGAGCTDGEGRGTWADVRPAKPAERGASRAGVVATRRNLPERGTAGCRGAPGSGREGTVTRRVLGKALGAAAAGAVGATALVDLGARPAAAS